MSIDINKDFIHIPETKLTVYKIIKDSESNLSVVNGKTVKLHVHGTVKKNNYVFWDTKSTNKPYSFKCGSDKVIKVWNKCIMGMKLGEIREFRIPPEDIEFGYVGFPVWNIPPNCEVIYIIEVLEIID